MLKLSLILGIAIALPCFVLSANSCHSSEAMKCVDIAFDWMLSLPKGSIPVTEAETDTMCTEIGKAISCVEQFIDACATPMQKELVDITTEGFRDFKTKFCAKGSPLREKYLKHAPCLNKVSQLDEMRDGMLYFLAAVEHLNDVPNNQKLLYSCCEYGKAYQDILDLIRRDCDEATVKADKEFTEMVVAQLPDVICNGFTGKEDKCLAILPPPGTKPTENLKGTEIYKIVQKFLSHWTD